MILIENNVFANLVISKIGINAINVMKLVVSALEGILINVSSVLTLAILLIKELVLDHKYADQEQ